MSCIDYQIDINFGTELGLYITNHKYSIMKKRLLPFGILFLGLLASSCYTDVVVGEGPIVGVPVQTALALESYDLWYVDIEATKGMGEVPFLEHAFTISFDRGVVFANNNLVGIGKKGNGLGIDVGSYGLYGMEVEIDHDLDGLWILEVYALGANTLELYDPRSNTSYVLRGYSRYSIDYDRVFYDNIHYFLQEYELWEKTYTSNYGALNEFDAENYLQFHDDGGGFFRSSMDRVGIPLSQVQWDYQGDYTVYNVPNDPLLKTLTLDYDYLGNDYFELYVIDDGTLELYHVPSGTVYEFRGRGYIQYLKTGLETGRKRTRTSNPTMEVERQRKL